ncbi:hypothetical protein ACH5RR_004712 [Cinchona calisaya]|uniref:Reverse transcriptase n=1 Tax=Cinchona calisaya TaxID=153742 RepID=A0ABD3AYH1_9GENT
MEGRCNSEKEIDEEVVRFYQQLFTSSSTHIDDEILTGIPQTITAQMNYQLTKPVTELEVKTALFSMHPHKATGPDGMSPSFFQNYWHIINRDVVDAVKSFFHSAHMFKAVNETIITLIPKISSPTNLTHDGPIN